MKPNVLNIPFLFPQRGISLSLYATPLPLSFLPLAQFLRSQKIENPISRYLSAKKPSETSAYRMITPTKATLTEKWSIVI